MSAPDQIEADIQRYYPGRRIAEWWRTITFGTGEMSSRELVVLIDQLPDDSATRRAKSSAWTLSERMLALQVNIANGLREDYRSVHGEDYSYEEIQPPKLEHEITKTESDRDLGRMKSRVAHDAISAMLRGELRMSDITPTAEVSEFA